MTTMHEAKPSYFGNQVTFEFPPSNAPSDATSDDGDAEQADKTTTTIERAGSIFIKSGIPKIRPFADAVNKPESPISYTSEASATVSPPNVSKRVFSPQTSILQTRDSLRQVNFTTTTTRSTTSSFVNPYLKGSILRRHQKEVENDEMLKNRVMSMKKNHAFEDDHDEDDFDIVDEDIVVPEAEEKVEELVIPRRSSKRAIRFGGFSAASILRKNSRLNSKKSINTLNSAKSNNSFKSVDMTGLDNLLGDLLNYKDGSRKSSRVASQTASPKNSPTNSPSKSPSRTPTTKPPTRIPSTLHQIKEHKKLESYDSSNISIKPFNVSKSIRRNKSLARSVSNASSELKSLIEEGEKKKETPVYKKELPQIKEEEATEKCELKRSNAVKRKPILIEYIVNILNAIKNAGKKCWRMIRGSSKKNISFQRKSSIKKRRDSNATANLSGGSITIGEPVLVDISKTAFKSQMLNHQTHPSISKKLQENEESMKSESTKSSPLSAKSVNGRYSPLSGKSGRSSPLLSYINVGGRNSPISSSYSKTTKTSSSTSGQESGSVETALLMNEKRLSTIPSINELDEGNDELGDLNKELVMLWKHYLGTSIRNRIDLKVDINKLNMIERVKSIHSDASRRNSIDISGKREVDKIWNKYVASQTSSRSSTISGSMVTAPLIIDGSGRRVTGASGETWVTVDSGESSEFGDGEGVSGGDGEDASSISTIEEEDNSDFDGFRSHSTRSSVSDLSEVYDEYSLLSDREDAQVGEEVEDEEEKVESTGLGLDSVHSSNIGSGFGSNSGGRGLIKQSDRMLNLQSVLKKSNSVYSGTGSSDERSDVFSFTRSVDASVCRV